MQPKGFKSVRGNVLVVIGIAGTRKVIGYNPKTNKVLLQDEKRDYAPVFSKSVGEVYVNMNKLLRATY